MLTNNLELYPDPTGGREPILYEPEIQEPYNPDLPPSDPYRPYHPDPNGGIVPEPGSGYYYDPNGTVAGLPPTVEMPDDVPNRDPYPNIPMTSDPYPTGDIYIEKPQIAPKLEITSGAKNPNTILYLVVIAVVVYLFFKLIA